jgi:hypothetical protein
MEILNNPRFTAMIMCLAVSVFSISLNGHLRNNPGEALFGFLGMVWLAVSIVVFLVFGWKVGFLCVTGSYLLGMVLSPVSGLIADLLRGDEPRG